MSRRGLVFALAVALLAACAGPQKTAPVADGPPPSASRLALAAAREPVPKVEPLSALGNPDVYEVAGQQYRVLRSAKGFTQNGLASWYGRKFHGRQTSNGEPYDMFAMTAAHKRLPLPSYVQVTNLENDREIVVRVNDRGPFHEDRIIDLSYAAASRLGIVDAGTAPVRIRTLTSAGDDAKDPALYLQTGAFADAGNAGELARQLEKLGVAAVAVTPSTETDALYRVRVGPFADIDILAATRRRLADAGVNTHTTRH